MKHLLLLIGIAALILGATAPVHAEEEWQTNSKWCASDNGVSNRRYLAACTVFDQYTSILACQEHNRNAKKTIVDAGRKKVNDYMDGKSPGVCVGVLSGK